jgi:hypothetical protein
VRPGAHAVAALAARQHGVVAHRQLLEAAIDVSAPRTGHGRPRVTLHRVRRLHPDDQTVCRAIPVTTVARTLLDLAEVLRPGELETAFEEADRLRLLDVRTVEALCQRTRGRRGLRPLRALVAEHRGPRPATRSELERRFIDLILKAGLPPPEVNTIVEGLEVDALWPDQRLVVELDGHAYHRRASFERDRIRDATLQLAGYRVLRVTHARLEREPKAITEAARSLLTTT